MQKIKNLIASLVLGIMVLLPFASIAQAFDITLNGVKDGGHYNADVRPAYSASSGASVSATLNGGNFASDMLVSKEGRYWLSIRASLNGQTQYKFAEFYLDKTFPVITINGVNDGQLTNHNVTPTFSTNEGNISATLNGLGFTSGTTVSSEGRKWLSVSARDESGNVTYGFREFTIDKTGPVISITGVSDGATYGGNATFYYSANEGNVSGTLNGSSVSSGTTVVSDGTYHLVVSATDTAGNTSNRSLTFYINRGGGNDGKDGKNGQDGQNGQNGQNGTNGTSSTITETIYRYLGGVSRAYAQAPIAEELAKPLEEPVPDYLSTLKVISVENADNPGAELDTCHNVRIIGRAKEGLLVILYLKREGSETPVIGFTKATSGDVFEFVSDEPLKAGEYTIYGKAAEEGGKTGPMLMLKTFDITGCKWWVVWLWVLIVIVLLVLGFLVGWYLRRRSLSENERLEEDLNPPHITESRL